MVFYSYQWVELLRSLMWAVAAVQNHHHNSAGVVGGDPLLALWEGGKGVDNSIHTRS